MKKTFIALLMLIALVVLVGCTKETTNAKQTTKVVTEKKTYVPTFWDQDANGIEDWTEKEINLTFATWQYNDKSEETSDDSLLTIDTLMIQAFTEKYPNVHVSMQIIGEDYEWDTNMQAQAEVGNLPDVFLIYRLETALPYNILANITEYYENDPDTEYIFPAFQNAGVYNNTRYAVPTFFYPEYWFVNLDILQNNGISAPSYNWTWDQMESIAAACYNESTHTVGQYGVNQYYRCLPKILSGNSNWQSYTFDGEKFNFDSQYFEDSFTKLDQALKNNAVTIEYSEEKLAEYYGDGQFEVAYDGYSAIWSSPSWEAKGFFDTMSFNWDVYPAPGGTINGNIDIAGVSSTCKSKGDTYEAAAYQLLKWLSYSEEGLQTRYELYAEYSDILFKSADNYPYPIVDYGIDKYGVNKVWDNIPYDNVPGMTSNQMINAIKNAAVWGNKEVPGWDATNQALNTYFYDIYTGVSTFAANKQTIVDLSNSTFKDFRDALDGLIG